MTISLAKIKSIGTRRRTGPKSLLGKPGSSSEEAHAEHEYYGSHENHDHKGVAKNLRRLLKMEPTTKRRNVWVPNVQITKLYGELRGHVQEDRTTCNSHFVKAMICATEWARLMWWYTHYAQRQLIQHLSYLGISRICATEWARLMWWYTHYAQRQLIQHLSYLGISRIKLAASQELTHSPNAKRYCQQMIEIM
jgi:hypothetical protein